MPSVQDVKVPFPRRVTQKSRKTNQIKTSKYTWYSFLPRNMYEQLHKFGNFYFLVISFIMYLGEKTSLYVGTIKAFSTVSVLVMMMAITATMALLDDLRRKEADREINYASARYWPWKETPVKKVWQDVAIGDVLIVREDEEFPADLVPFFCSGEGGNCYVSTANLDGETNLKLKSAPKAVQAACLPHNSNYNPERRNIGLEMFEKDVLETMTNLKGNVVAEEPNSNIYGFKGSLSLDAPQKSNESLGAQQLLLRGTKLRNTGFVVGIVVYCGADTRMTRNSHPTPVKVSSLEFFTNNSMKLILMAQGCLALLSSLCFKYNKAYFSSLWYLHLRNDLWLWDLPAYWLTFFTLYSNLMPISLYPTTEFCNAMQSFFIRNDKEMLYHSEDFDRGVPFAAKARSSSLCQELGQIKYLFSDKTGTLTQNVMELKRLSINNKKYGRLVPLEVGFNGKENLGLDRQKGDQTGCPIESFLEVLAVAHTVMVSKGEDGILSYEAESPDEHALVKAASELGWTFESRKGSTLTCSFCLPSVEQRRLITSDSSQTSGPGNSVQPGTPSSHSYTVLATNAFNSSRKRMSIVVKKDGKEYLLFVKGADNVMLERAHKEAFHEKALVEDLNEFSREGLRTLVIGKKKLDSGMVEQWLKDYEDANRKTAGREEALDAVAERLEKDIEILGATAIEDKLQEQVPETIEKIRKAGIKLWVLTGDKLETARNIGYSTKVLATDMNIQTLDNGEEGGSDLAKVSENLQAEAQGQAMMVTGKALASILSDKRDKNKFLEAAQKCDVLIACRVSPMQKATLVRLIRESAPKGQEPITAAIGDGANDVPMIQEAQVGIGIAGREGRQSVNSSDFAIGQFKYLQQLLFIHGRWNYLRACKFTLFTFWRNMVEVLLIFSYTFFSGFSGTVLFEDWLRLTFNGFGTLPVLAVGSFDQDVKASVVLANPSLYVVGREGQELNVVKTLQTFFAAVFHAAIIFSVTWLASPGMDMWSAGDYYTFGSAVYTCLIINLTYRVAFLTCSHNKYTLAVIVFSLGGYVYFLCVYPCVSLIANIFEPNMYMVPAYMVSNAYFWICLLAIPMITWSVDSVTSWANHTFFPDALDKLMTQDWDGESENLPANATTHSLTESQAHPQASCSVGSQTQAALTMEEQCHYAEHVNLTPFGQQKLKSWRVRTNGPAAMMKIIFGCGLTLLLMGWLANYHANNVAQLKVVYHMARQGETHLAGENSQDTLDDEIFDRIHHCDPTPGTDNGNLTCHTTVPREMKPPLLVYYAVAPFYQNIVTYMKSEVPKEVMGRRVDDETRKARCLDEKSRERNGKSIVPCGAKAATLFNDTLQLLKKDGRPINISKRGVAWNSDVKRYNNPDDYLIRTDTMWLYELFPNVIKRDEGVKSEAFAAWMRPAAFGRVLNHYGWVHEKLEAGDTISFRIESSFNAPPESSKMFVITERNVCGGRHTALGTFLMKFGGMCLVVFYILCLDQCFRVYFGQTASEVPVNPYSSPLLEAGPNVT